MSEFQPPDGLNTEEAAELANVLPATHEEAYAEGRKDEREECMRLLNWAFGKLMYVRFSTQEDALMLDEIKLMQMGAQ